MAINSKGDYEALQEILVTLGAAKYRPRKYSDLRRGSRKPSVCEGEVVGDALPLTNVLNTAFETGREARTDEQDHSR
jgi:hypothetical protein